MASDNRRNDGFDQDNGGKLRSSSLIGPWGVGSIVSFPNNESLMIAGLDQWKYREPKDFVIHEDRLSRRLGVSELRWPPDYRERSADPVNYGLKIPAVRFPTWYYCPFCGQMKKTTYFATRPTCDARDWPDGRKCRKPGRPMIPERFVVVCPEGHIDDFPVAEWVHSDGVHEYNSDTCVIRRSTGGASASLTGVFYKCTCGASKSLAGATRKGALKRIEYKCKATKPWLNVTGEEECQADPREVRVVLRGATNVWFADTRSSISIPTDIDPEQNDLARVVNHYLNLISTSRTNGQVDRLTVEMIAKTENVNADKLYEAFKKRLSGEVPDTSSDDGDISEDQYRQQEYEVLCKNSGSDEEDFHSICHAIQEYDPVLNKYFDSISLVPKLREVRAFVGFSRLEPDDKKISERKKELRLGKGEDWLPAIEVFGEGIFFKFNGSTLAEWVQKPEVIKRISSLNESFQKSNFRRESEGSLRPEFVLIHTFAHLMINQLSFDCGYGTSSLRERLFCERSSDELDMYGLLIYTASGDSEGSLGGLVRQGESGFLERIVVDAVQNASWCSSDPVCIQSTGQGPESLNLAACHNCALLPETSCENGNRLLDRGFVVGTMDNPEMGFFSDLLDK